MRVALVHDYLREYGGAERVLEELHQVFPQAPVYTAFYDPSSLGKQASRFADWDIRQSVLTKFPFYKKLFSPYRIFASWAFEQFDLSEYDVIISSTNAYMAKAVKTNSQQLHLSYIHTPSRALYGYSTRSNWKRNPFFRVGGELINFWMRYVDYQTAQRPDVLIANSQTTAERITKYYRRQSTTIYPPVKMVDQFVNKRIASTSLPKVTLAKARHYLLFVGRLVLSKHPELAVQISNHTGYPLKVVGTGVMMEQLRQQAGSQVEFLGGVDDQALQNLYARAKITLFPAEDEDFGIVPIESLAAGTPVVAHQSGEPRFTIDKQNGLLVPDFDVSSWVAAVKQAWKKKWSHQQISKMSKKYSATNFDQQIEKLITNRS